MDITSQFTDNMIQRRRKYFFQYREYIDLSFDISVFCLASPWQGYLVEPRPGSPCVQADALFESLAETLAAGRLLQCGTWDTNSPQISPVRGDFTDRGDEGLLRVKDLGGFMETFLVFRC